MIEPLEWFFKADEISGPYSTDKIISMLGSGKISQESLLLIGETGQWQPASNYSELQAQSEVPRPLVRPWVRFWARFLDMYVWTIRKNAAWN